MTSLKINNITFWPYEWIINSENKVKWNVLPIFYDTATIELKDNINSFTIGYKVTNSIFWKQIKSADIINEITWETFSLQVNNIFVCKVFNWSPEIIALVWDKLKLYKDFWKTSIDIEQDWDKKNIVPLGEFDMFVWFTQDYYYPIFLWDNNNHNVVKNFYDYYPIFSWDNHNVVKKFYDYFWYKSYTDLDWTNHFLLLVEWEDSTDLKDAWYFLDNFVKISKRLDFWDDSEYIEDWNIDEYWDIYMQTTSWQYWYLDKITWNTIKTVKNKSNNFTYTRYFEDTDSIYIIWKNDRGVFIIDRTLSKIDKKTQNNIKYFKDCISSFVDKKEIYFLLEDLNWDIVLVDHSSNVLCYTDLTTDKKLKNISVINNILEVYLKDWELRKYLF